jgi:hypothetical protein
MLTPLASFYPFLLVLLGINYLPDSVKHKCAGGIAFLGRASYHIFLVQIIFFGAEWTSAYLALTGALHLTIISETVLLQIGSLLTSIAICIVVRLAFQQISNLLTVFVLKEMNKHSLSTQTLTT